MNFNTNDIGQLVTWEIIKLDCTSYLDEFMDGQRDGQKGKKIHETLVNTCKERKTEREKETEKGGTQRPAPKGLLPNSLL